MLVMPLHMAIQLLNVRPYIFIDMDMCPRLALLKQQFQSLSVSNRL